MLFRKKFFCFPALFLVLLFSSCTQSLSKRGCTDKDAENFEPKASKDCSCCFYTGRVFIWINYRDESKFSGITKLYVYANDELVKTFEGISSIVEASSDPASSYKPFDQYSSLYSENAVLIDIGPLKSATVHLVLKIQTGDAVFDQNVDLGAKTVFPLQLR